MGEMADFYEDQEEEVEMDEHVMHKSEKDKDLRIFIVTYNNGNFHSSTNDATIAWETARRIDGIIGELTNVYRPKFLEEVMPPELARKVTEFLDNPERGERRGRPVRKPDEAERDAA